MARKTRLLKILKQIYLFSRAVCMFVDRGALAAASCRMRGGMAVCVCLLHLPALVPGPSSRQKLNSKRVEMLSMKSGHELRLVQTGPAQVVATSPSDCCRPEPVGQSQHPTRRMRLSSGLQCTAFHVSTLRLRMKSSFGPKPLVDFADCY